MTKAAIAEKVAKLRRLADSPSANPFERDNARRAADALIAAHGLTAEDLRTGSICDAFDDLIVSIERLALGGGFGSSTPITEAISEMKRSTKPEDKAQAVTKIVQVVRVASIFLGGNETVRRLKGTIDEVLAAHHVTI